jgi:hypothetical protein
MASVVRLLLLITQVCRKSIDTTIDEATIHVPGLDGVNARSDKQLPHRRLREVKDLSRTRSNASQFDQ